MFEKGNGTKLSTEYVEKIAKRLGLDLAALLNAVVKKPGAPRERDDYHDYQ